MVITTRQREVPLLLQLLLSPLFTSTTTTNHEVLNSYSSLLGSLSSPRAHTFFVSYSSHLMFTSFLVLFSYSFSFLPFIITLQLTSLLLPLIYIHTAVITHAIFANRCTSNSWLPKLANSNKVLFTSGASINSVYAVYF